MALSAAERQRIYQEERKRLEEEAERERVRKQLLQEQKRKQSSSGAFGCLIVLIIAVAVYALVRPVPTSGPRGAPSPVAPSTPQASRPMTGEEGRLRSGSADVLVAVDEDSFSKLIDSGVARDNEGLVLLIASGKVFRVPSGTKVRVLSPGFLKSEVRVLEGDHYARSGFVPVEWVEK